MQFLTKPPYTAEGRGQTFNSRVKETEFYALAWNSLSIEIEIKKDLEIIAVLANKIFILSIKITGYYLNVRMESNSCNRCNRCIS